MTVKIHDKVSGKHGYLFNTLYDSVNSTVVLVCVGIEAIESKKLPVDLFMVNIGDAECIGMEL